ncbi:MAG: hypothetical protein GF334_04840 [Candidatus Altiarchaeales archaeon]|nr:hypothetical protein [Candidatus Altiarchaeales archaeon]
MFRVGIDLDNTVADYLKGITPLIKEAYGLEPDLSRKAYCLEEVFGITPEQRPKDMRRKLYVEQRAFRNLPPIEEDNYLLTEELKKLFRSDPFKIYFITARDPHPVIKEDSLDWVQRNTSHFDDVFHTSKKAEFCKAAGVSVMMEDEVRQILPLLEEGINVVVMDQPWNQHLPEDPHGLEGDKGRYIRVSNWREALKATEEFYSGFNTSKENT